jgi:SAM-dependent methyltransferase
MGIQKWLRLPALYNVFQDAIGGNSLRKWFIETYARAKPGDKVIDIGCGPGQIVPLLPPVDYVGFDVNKSYIASAQQKYGDRAMFLAGDITSLRNDSRLRAADLVLGIGILHHLDDARASECVRFAHCALKRGGRFVCLEACWIAEQGMLSRYIMAKDRGQYIRTERASHDLLTPVFKSAKASIQRRPMRIPYVTVVFECTK